MRNRTRKFAIMLTATLISMFALVLMAEVPPTAPADQAAQPGRPAPDFALQDVYGKTFTLSEFQGKIVVIDFISVRCPWSLGFDPELKQMWKDYAPKGVQFIAINSNHNDTLDEVRLHQVAKDLTFPILKDPGNRVADAYLAVTTPHFYVVDKDGTLVYAGKPCDSGKPEQPEVKSNSVRMLLDKLTAGEKVEPTQTKPWGCTIKRAK